MEVEGINSLISSAVGFAPSISLPLLDARVGLRKWAGLGTKEDRVRWNLVKERPSV